MITLDELQRPVDLQLSQDFGVSLRLQNLGTIAGGLYEKSATDSLQKLPSDYIIQERYRVLSVLGTGGMGCVYHVEHIFLRKEFALKTLNPNNMSDISWRRFQKEAHAANMLDHPRLIKVHDFGIIEGEQPFFVMDYFGGETLAYHLKTFGSLPIDEALDMSIQVCNALGYAHGQGVIHRDIKPSNIMLTKSLDQNSTETRIVDFGIAKLGKDGHEQLAMTRTGEIFGTPYYMSPEQCFGKPLDHRADIYSVGCMMYETLTGVPPFIGDNALTIMMKHQGEKPSSLKEASLGKTFSADLEKVVAKLLEKDPADRYQSLLDVESDLKKLKAGEKTSISSSSAKKVAVESTENKRRQPIWQIVSTLGITTIAVACCIAALFLVRSGKWQTLLAPPAVATATAATAAVAVPPTIKNEVPAEKESVWIGGYFSESTSTKRRVFHFPTNLEESPGRLSGTSQNVEMRFTDQNGSPSSTVGFASGNVTIEPFEPFRLTPTDFLCSHPEMLKRFRGDEIKAIRFNDTATVEDSTLDYLNGLTGLKELELDECVTVTDKSIPKIDRIPNLETLVLGRTHTTGAGVATLKRLRELKMLDIRCLPDATLVLTKLKGSTQLTFLGLRLTDLNNKTVELLTAFPNLEKLDIGGNHDITDEGFAKLAPLRNLTFLDISGCPISGKCSPTLSNFPKLQYLKMSTTRANGWGRDEMKALESALPKGCNVLDPDSRKGFVVGKISEK